MLYIEQHSVYEFRLGAPATHPPTTANDLVNVSIAYNYTDPGALALSFREATEEELNYPLENG